MYERPSEASKRSEKLNDQFEGLEDLLLVRRLAYDFSSKHGHAALSHLKTGEKLMESSLQGYRGDDDEVPNVI